jgi:hypothetical protein
MEENVENVVDETTQSTEQPVEETKKPNVNDDGDYVVDLSKPKTDEVKEDNPVDEGVVAEPENAESTEKQEEVQPETETQEQSVLEEVTEEEDVQEQTEELAEEITEAQETGQAETGKALPENLQKVVDFMEETGGTLEDYVRLNQDYSNYDDMTVLREYYKQTKKHLTADEVEFLIEDTFMASEDDSERAIKKKKIALKEQVASAKAHLDGQKSKYYEEVKAGSRLTPEQQKAVNFFNRYNKESEENKKIADKQTSTFLSKTNEVFNDKFKGFEYNVGDKKYRFNVKNAGEVKEAQSDINNFVKKFLNKNSEMSDAKGYHKSLFTAMNPDAIANHFYEQGKADALKESMAKSKNVDMNPRGSHSETQVGGMKFKVLGENSADFKFKIKNK